MPHQEGRFSGAGSQGLHYQCWEPEARPRAIVAVVHGFGEHGGRYGNVVRHLVPHGYAVYAFDHRGHGARRASEVTSMPGANSGVMFGNS